MVSRKRGREEMEDEAGMSQEEPSMLQKIRNMWEFASLMQYIFFFGKAVKIEEVEVEEFEQECLKPTHSEHLSRMGLALLKYVSSHKGLTLDIFDEYTRRQYQAKAPQSNPFGDEEEPNKFADFDVFTKIRVLHQLSIWTLNNPNPIREKMAEIDETQWRIEPLGWDSKDREYYVLDDDRLYRRTAPPLPPEPKTPKNKPKPKRNTRSNKRRRISRAIPDTSPEDSEATPDVNGFKEEKEDEQNNFAGFTWQLIAISLEEYNAFLCTIRKSRDDNEKILRRRIESEVLPVIELRAEEKAHDAARRLKELENMQKLATAKRSSRIADKMEKQRVIQQAEEAERKRQADIEMAHREQERQDKLDAERQSRMMTREQRIKEREVKRILQEEQLAKEKEQLAKLEEEGRIENAERARISERNLKSDMQKRQKVLENLQQQDDDWIFDCSVCGLHGQNLDDGTHSIACEKCSVWQHSTCHGITKEQAERDDFHFLCRDCKRRMENPIPPLKLRFGTSASPPSAEKTSKGKATIGMEIPAIPKTSRPMKIPNGFNMSSMYTQGHPLSIGSNVVNGGTTPAAHHLPTSPTKSASPLVYPGPPPTLTPHHAYTHTSPSPPRPSSSGYGSHTMNGHASATTTLSQSPSSHYRPNGGSYPSFNNTIYTPQSYGSWQNVQPFHSPYPRQSPPSQNHNYYRQPPPQSTPIPAPSYSPQKPQPPSPSRASINGHVGYQPLSAPPTLSPTQGPPILSPPVKKATPTPTPERPVLTGGLDTSQRQPHPQPSIQPQPQQLLPSPVKTQSTIPATAVDSQIQNPIVPAVTEAASVTNHNHSEST